MNLRRNTKKTPGTRGKNEKHQFRPDDNYDEVRFKLQSFHTRVVVAEVVVVVVVVVY